MNAIVGGERVKAENLSDVLNWYHTKNRNWRNGSMLCPKCGKEMKQGYLFASKDGAFSFAESVPGVFENARNAEGFVQITELKPGHRTSVAASCCRNCRLVVLKY